MVKTLPTAYLPPVSYVVALLSGGAEDGGPCIEQWESYQKQTLRNRCYIDSPDGPIPLTIPVRHDGTRLVRDIRLSDHGHWRRQHWQALRSSYAASPFFDFYQDDLRPVYEGNQRFLIDFNEEILIACLRLIDIPLTIRRTTSFQGPTAVPPPAELPPYYHVFGPERWPANAVKASNLSVVDLLFNMGPESLLFFDVGPVV